MLVHYGCLWGKQQEQKNKHGAERLTAQSPRRPRGRTPCAAHRDVLGRTKRERAAGRASRLAQATSTGLSFALLKKWVLDLVREEREGQQSQKE